MDFRDLRYFETVADTGHLGRAAAKVFRSQPALTKSIQRLEADLGAELFERSGRMLKLTPVGRVLLERARFLRRAMEDAAREVSDVARGVAGHVRVGTAATAAEFLLPQVTASLLRTTPGVTMEVVIGMNDVLRASLREGHLDLVIGPVTGTDAELDMQAIAQDEVVVAARKGHPLLRSPVKLEDLCAYRWVLPGRSVATRAWLDRVFESSGLPLPLPQIESNSISLMPRLIAKTDLLSFISRRNLGAGKVGAPLREVKLAKTTMKRQFGVAHRSRGYLSPAALTILKLLKDEGAAMFNLD